MAKGWLDNYGEEDNYNDSQASAPEGFQGDGYSNVGRNYSPAWGGQFQMGGSVYPVNYVPQAQNGKRKPNIQDKVEDWLGHPMQKAEQAADEYTDPGEDQTDNIRHPMAGRFTSEAIQNKFPSWMQYTGIPQAAGFLGGSVAGLGHELIEPNRGTVKHPYSIWDTIKEGSEDQLNNMVGAAIGSTPFISKKQKSEAIKYLSDNNLIPDGYRDKDNMYKKHAMGGSIPGAVGFSYARTQGAAPSNGPYAKKTKASAQNGVDMYGSPITAIEVTDPNLDRSHYDPRLNIVNIGNDYNTWHNNKGEQITGKELEEHRNKLKTHEHYHAKQHKEGRDNYDIAHHTNNEQWAQMQKRPQMMTTNSEWNKFYNRGDIENTQDYTNYINAVPEARILNPNLLYNKVLDSSRYANPFNQEGEAMYYEQMGKDFSPYEFNVPKNKNGGWLDQYDVAQNGKRLNDAAQMINTINARKQPGYHRDSPNINIKEIPRQSINDKIAAPKKLHTTDLDKLNVRNKTKAELDAQELANDNAIAAQRLAVRKNAEANPLHSWAGTFDSKNWNRQNVEDSSADLESMFRMSDEPNFFDDYVNPASWVGRMAANLGAAPNQIVQQDSMAPLVLSIAEPLAFGASEEILAPYISKGLNSGKNFINSKRALPIIGDYKVPTIAESIGNYKPYVAEAEQSLEPYFSRIGESQIGEYIPHQEDEYIKWFNEQKNKSNPTIPIQDKRSMLRGSSIIDINDVPPAKFNSEIDWSKWNKEIPDNPQLMKEYNAIEQTSKANGSWMKNPDGSTFQGTPEQFVQQNSENFKKAFGNSKLVNTDGSPKIIYHGTRNGNLINDEFKAPSSISDDYKITSAHVTDHNYFASNKEVAERYANSFPRNNSDFKLNPKVYETYANIENPYLANDFEIATSGKIPNISNYDSATNLDLGINAKNKFAEVAIPYWNKVKSATGNNGMFDMTNPNIYKAIVPGAIGLGAASQLNNEEEVSGFKQGGIIKDDRGQWDYPGEITRISGGNITMKRDPRTGKALTQPILGIADTGEEQMMYPGEDYTFEGANYVTEYPKGKRPKKAKNGIRQEQKGLQNLDNLVNFTNYNKPQPGGWLSKYE